MEKIIAEIKNVPPPEAPLSHAVILGNLVFTCGQVSLDLESREAIPGTIEEETERAIKNLKRILESVGSSLDHVLKTTLYMTNLEEWGRMNEVYKKFFVKDPPARSTVGVNLSGNYNFEIEAVAYIPSK